MAAILAPSFSARGCLPGRGVLRLRRPAAVLRSARLRHPKAPVLQVVGQSAAGAGSASPPLPPQQQQFPRQPAYQQPVQQYQQPMQQQQQQPLMRQPGQRVAVPRRRIGANVPPQPQQASTARGLQQQLTSVVARGVGQQAAAAAYDPAPIAVQRGQGQFASDMVLPRSLLMGKEVITRTTAKRLGYVNQLFVDPSSFSVASLYLRSSASNILAINTDHIMLASMRQISDVVLVHDELALTDPPADDSVGYCRLAGAEVVTEAGVELGRVRDFLFDPDNGAISTIKYDQLGQPWVPQALFSCYSISWEDVVALGPMRLIVRHGTEQRAIKENEGIADGGLSKLRDLLLDEAKDGERRAAGGSSLAGGAYGMSEEEELRYRDSPTYRAWYEQYGRNYEATYGTPVPAPPDRSMRQAQAPQQYQQPRALPPPQSTTFAHAVQPQQKYQQQQYQQQSYQQALQQQRQAVPAGAGSGGGNGGTGWGTPPPPAAQQQQYAFPAQALQQQQGPPPGAQYGQPPPSPPQQYQQYQQPAAPRSPQQQPLGPRPVQQGRPLQAPRPAAQPQKPPLPQSGIPIFPTPASPYRRRDADGNYGAPPPAQQQQRQQPRAQAPTAAARQQPPLTARQPTAQQPTAQQLPVVEPDAIIPGGL